MDLKQTLQPAGNSGIVNKALEEHWPKIQLLIKEKVGPAALSAAQNDQAMAALFKNVYPVLPFPVRMVVKEDAFIRFCLEHRTKLLPATPPQAAS